MLVLAIDTSTPAITAGVVRLKQPHELLAELQQADRGAAASAKPAVHELLADSVVEDAFGHAEKLMPLIEQVVGESGGRLTDLGAIVVGVGPGPYTGLRVGIATAVALGDGLVIPVHGVPSHDAMARSVAASAPFAVITDARRREVYVSVYAETAVRILGPEVIAPQHLVETLAGLDRRPTAVTGAGVSIVAGSGYTELPAGGSLALALVECAAQPLLTGMVPGPIAPLYLRRPDAAEPAAPKPALPRDAEAAVSGGAVAADTSRSGAGAAAAERPAE